MELKEIAKKVLEEKGIKDERIVDFVCRMKEVKSVIGDRDLNLLIHQSFEDVSEGHKIILKNEIVHNLSSCDSRYIISPTISNSIGLVEVHLIMPKIKERMDELFPIKKYEGFKQGMSVDNFFVKYIEGKLKDEYKGKPIRSVFFELYDNDNDFKERMRAIEKIS